MDERADRGEFYPGGDRSGGAPAQQPSDKVDRVNLGELGENYTLEKVKAKVDQIVRVIAPAAVCLALAVVRMLSYAATAPIEKIPNTGHVVTNEEDAVAMAALTAATNALALTGKAAFQAASNRLDSATNVLAVQMAELRSAESNRIEATYAKRSEIPATPDLAPYALKSELPTNYITENDITNFATRAWIGAQGYATEAGVGARIDAQDLAIDAATNSLWQTVGSESNRLDSATNEVWQSALRADETLQREIDALRIVAADSNAVTRLVTPDGTTWQDATGGVWRVEQRLVGDLYMAEDREFENKSGPIGFDEDTYVVQNGSGYEIWLKDYGEMEGYQMSQLSGHEGWWKEERSYGTYFLNPSYEAVTTLVTRVVYTNDLATATNAAYEAAVAEAQERITSLAEMGTVFAATRLVDQTGGGYDDVTASNFWETAATAARSATNYTDTALGLFASTGTVSHAVTADSASTSESAMSATWAGRLSSGGSVGADNFTYEDIVNGFTAGTNYANEVADAKISTNNAAFVSAVLAAPLAGADAEDIAEIAEYGGYGTVGAALLALIAGLAALKRRVGATETALSGKAAVTHNHAASDVTSGKFLAERLPVATPLAVGAVRPDGTTVTVDANGVISASGGGGGGAIATISLAGDGSRPSQCVSIGSRKYYPTGSVVGETDYGRQPVIAPVFAGEIVSVNFDDCESDCLIYKNGVMQRSIPSTLTAGDAWLICFGSCLAYGTLVLMADGTFKRVEDVSVGDEVASADPSDGVMSRDVVVNVSRGFGSEKDDWTFEGGRTVSTVGRHRFWNVDLEEMLYLEAWNPGERARVFDGTDVKLVSRAKSFGEFRHATLWTKKWNNYFANGLLAGNRNTVKGAY